MSIKRLVAIFAVFLAISATGLLADPVILTMDDLVQIGETQKGSNNKLDDAIELSGITGLQWAGGSFDTSSLSVWDYDNGVYWWLGPEEVTHISVKAGNSWILYELETPLQPRGFITLESEIFGKTGNAIEIGHVTGYTGGITPMTEASTSVPEPATFLLLGLGLLAVPGIKKVINS